MATNWFRAHHTAGKDEKWYRQALGVVIDGHRHIAILGTSAALMEGSTSIPFAVQDLVTSWPVRPIALCDASTLQYYALIDEHSRRLLHFTFGAGD